MTRVKRSVHAQKKRRKVLEQAKGYWGWKHSHYRYAKEQVEHSLNLLLGVPVVAVLPAPVPLRLLEDLPALPVRQGAGRALARLRLPRPEEQEAHVPP